MKLSIAFVIFFTPVGYALAGKYPEPSGETASLRIVLINPEAYSVHIAAYDPITCKKTSDVGWVSGGRKIDAVRIGMPDSEPPREGILERRIPANQPFSFGTSFIMPKQSIASSLMGAVNPAGASADNLRNAMAAICEAPVFTPAPGALYQLTFQPRPQGCESSLSRLESNHAGDMQWIPVSTERIRFPVSVSKPVCPGNGA
jgi:hypothetical protein